MRSLIVSCNVTVDGFMAGPDGDVASLDFITPDPDQEAELAARFRSDCDTFVIGRRTFADMAGFWPTAAGPMAQWINGASKVVLTTDEGFDAGVWADTTTVRADGLDGVRSLKRGDGAALVVFGGVQTVRSVIAADLVDEYRLKVSPIAIGTGCSLFTDITARRPLLLGGVRQYPSGMLDVTYRRPASVSS